MPCASDEHSPASCKTKRFMLALTTYSGFVGVVAVANVLASMAGGREESPQMMAAGILFFLFFLTILIVGGVIIFGVLDHRRLTGSGASTDGSWPRLLQDGGRDESSARAAAVKDS